MGRLQDNQYSPLVLKSNQEKAKLKEERANNEAKLQVCLLLYGIYFFFF